MTQRVPYHFARTHGVVDVERASDGTQVLMRRGASLSALAELKRLVPAPCTVQLVDDDVFGAELARLYSDNGRSSVVVADALEGELDLSRLAEDVREVEDLMETADDAPIIRLINALLTEALREGASDVHIEAFETRSVVRFRVDGQLRDVLEPKRALHGALVSRIKVMAGLDIAEKRLPQDGRITLRIAGRPVDVRVSTLPTGHGERAVLRLLDKSAGRLDLSRLGMPDDLRAQLEALLAEPHGILLVTGPTGSGKTTTLYAALSSMDATSTNIMTVEDPIEYDLDGVGQTQVNPRIDMSFARALRAILRQDPDVIMIGEIRDLETAQIAVQASLTGHLVLATLHTNDSASAVTRLVDMGIEPFLLASSLIGVLAQRLARTLCAECRVAYPADAAEAEALSVSAGTLLYRAAGCATCGHTGYRGRTGLYELLRVDEVVRGQVHEGLADTQIKASARTRGLRTLREDGALRVCEGRTAFDEVVRVTRDG
ncbi:type II secretion system ATPase GspE [Chitinibacteraceae bacterium HSL-7]